jgi:hypothetical protein
MGILHLPGVPNAAATRCENERSERDDGLPRGVTMRHVPAIVPAVLMSLALAARITDIVYDDSRSLRGLLSSGR